MASSSSIAVFDSGVGGLSILDKIHQLLPNENLLYLADSAHAPYGSKTEVVIQQRCQQAMRFFKQNNVKAVVLACNTATAAAVALLRQEHDLPIIGMEPAIKPAAQQSKSGVVGVLATAGTIDSEKFFNLKSQLSDQVEIITKACPGLVERIEQQPFDHQATCDLVKAFAAPLVAKGADTLVLGCTHYSLIADLILESVGNRASILDTGFAVAKELQRRLQESDLETIENSSGIEFFSTGNVSDQKELFNRYWQKDVLVNSVELPSL